MFPSCSRALSPCSVSAFPHDSSFVRKRQRRRRSHVHRCVPIGVELRRWSTLSLKCAVLRAWILWGFVGRTQELFYRGGAISVCNAPFFPCKTPGFVAFRRSKRTYRQAAFPSILAPREEEELDVRRLFMATKKKVWQIGIRRELQF